MKRAIAVAMLALACSGAELPPPPPPPPHFSYRLVGVRLECAGAVAEFHDPVQTYVDFDHRTKVLDIATEGCYFLCADGTTGLVEANVVRSPPEVSVFASCA